MDGLATLFYVFSLLFHEFYYLALGLVSLWAVYAFDRKKEFAVALVLAVLLALALKGFYAEPRPCSSVEGLAACPPSEGFPSIHSVFAAVIALGGLGGWLFFAFAPLGFLIAYSRIFLGVHTVDQVYAGLALGAICYLAVWHFFDRKKRKAHEPLRKVAHVGGGLALLALGVLLGREAVVNASALAFVTGLLLSQAALLGLIPLPLRKLFDLLSGGEHPPARGGLCFFASVIALFTFAHSTEFALAVLGIMTVGDGLAAFVGKNGRHKIPWNKSKTLEGLGAFVFGGCAVAYLFVGALPALLYAVILGVVETLDVGVDDNILIPVSALAVKAVGG